MKIPHENALAFFPPSVSAGNLTLGPLTLAGAVRIAELGVDLGRRVPRDKIFQVAFVLEESRMENGKWRMENWNCSFPSFCRRARVGLKELSDAVETVLNEAFKTYVKPAVGDGGTVHLTPHGLGLPLEYAEFLCSEYGWSWQTAVNTPLATVHALIAAYRQRNGGKSSFDYIEREYAKTIKGR